MRCWTCGTQVSEFQFNCPACKRSKKQLKVISEKFDKLTTTQQNGFASLEKVQQEGFENLQQQLSDMNRNISEGFAQVASAIEWGFGEISWHLEQQNNILRSIDHTLKTPSQTMANEWRGMAEELQKRGALADAKEFYVKALEENRLDYRIYIGLATTLLQENNLKDAKSYLERSLPHAPKKEIDYKSYSYRLLGHIYGCQERYKDAVQALEKAIDLSPHYADGHYDYAQYTALVGEKKESLISLQSAIAKPLHFSLAQYEKNFDPIRTDVQNFLIERGLSGTLAPEYLDGIFRLAKYCAAVGKSQECMSLLKQLIQRNPAYYDIIAQDTVFDQL